MRIDWLGAAGINRAIWSYVINVVSIAQYLLIEFLISPYKDYTGYIISSYDIMSSNGTVI